MADNVVSIATRNQVPVYLVDLLYKSGHVETFESTYFGCSPAVPGYLLFVRKNRKDLEAHPDYLVNSDLVASVDITLLGENNSAE